MLGNGLRARARSPMTGKDGIVDDTRATRDDDDDDDDAAGCGGVVDGWREHGTRHITNHN